MVKHEPRWSSNHRPYLFMFLLRNKLVQNSDIKSSLCLENPKDLLAGLLFFFFYQIEDLQCSNCVSHGTKHASLQIEPWSPPYWILLIFYCSDCSQCNTIYRWSLLADSKCPWFLAMGRLFVTRPVGMFSFRPFQDMVGRFDDNFSVSSLNITVWTYHPT